MSWQDTFNVFALLYTSIFKEVISRTQYYSADGFVIKEYFHFVKIQIIIVISNIYSILAFTLSYQ